LAAASTKTISGGIVDPAANPESGTENEPRQGLWQRLVRQKLVFWIVVALFLIGDLSSKMWAEHNLTERVPIYSTSNAEPSSSVTFLQDKEELKEQYDGVAWIPGVIHFRWAENYGAAFSIGSGQTLMLAILSLAVLGVILYYVQRSPRKRWFLLFCIGMITGGAIGNLTDRLTYDTVDSRWHIEGQLNPDYGKPTTAVRDFLYWPFDIPIYSTMGLRDDQLPRKWPIFNIADVGIVSGVIGVIGVFVLVPDDKKKKTAAAPAVTAAAAGP
jgi:lipoprotein signal peptidase